MEELLNILTLKEDPISVRLVILAVKVLFRIIKQTKIKDREKFGHYFLYTTHADGSAFVSEKITIHCTSSWNIH